MILKKQKKTKVSGLVPLTEQQPLIMWVKNYLKKKKRRNL